MATYSYQHIYDNTSMKFKKISIAALLLCLPFTAPSIALAQSTSATEAVPQAAFISRLAAKSLLTDIVTVGDRLVAVGERGHIIYSTDAKQWQQANVPVNVLLTDVYFLDQQLGWAVGHDATILHSNDGGVSWQLQQYLPSIDKPLFSIHFKDANNGIAVGAYGLFYRTVDGGKHWQKEFHDELLHPDDREYLMDLKQNDAEAFEAESFSILPHFNRLSGHGDNADSVYLVGEVGLVIMSQDFGQTWAKTEEFYRGSFFAINATADNQFFVAGLRGNIFTSTEVLSQNAQASWQRVNAGAKSSVNQIIIDGERMVLVGNSGTVYFSRDKGQTFTAHQQRHGKTITSGVWFKGQLVLASLIGINVVETGQW